MASMDPVVPNPRRCSRRVWLAGLLLLAGCSKPKENTLIGTFHMGEKVQAGPFVYTALEADWRTEIPNGPPPKNRFLFVRMSITNRSGNKATAPAFSLRGSGETTYQEITERLQDVDNWLGILREVKPAQTEQGWVIFDAPMGAYQLIVSDGGDVANERFAHIDIPVQISE